MARIAFIGLGTMGGPMAKNLLATGHRLVVHDLVEASTAEAVAAGAERVTVPAQAVAGADFVITMLPNGGIVKALLLGGGGLFAAVDGSKPLFIDCSTIAPEDARILAAEAVARGVEFIDAPVSGGVQGAREATLAFMVGGTDEQFSRAEPIIRAMARIVLHAGPAGSGQSAKICNNMLAAVIMAATCEALSLGERLGLEVATLSRIMAGSSGSSFLLERWNPYPGIVAAAPASRDYDNGFQLQLMLKDLGLALESARASHQPAPFGALAQNLYILKQQSEAGARLKDFSKIIDVFRAGLPGHTPAS